MWNILRFANGKIRIGGFALGRLEEFGQVLAREGRQSSSWGKLAVGVSIIRAALRLGGVGRMEWRARMRICAKCPILDSSLNRCRPYDGSILGCGCWAPGLALVKQAYDRPGCWWNQAFPDKAGGWAPVADGGASGPSSAKL